MRRLICFVIVFLIITPIISCSKSEKKNSTFDNNQPIDNYTIKPPSDDEIFWRDDSLYTITNNKIEEEINVEKENIEVHIKYPTIRGVVNKNAEKNLNEWIKNFVDKELQDFKNFIGTLKTEIYNQEPKLDSEFYCNSHIMLLNQKICSISFDFYKYAGGAHGSRSAKNLNIDLVDNKIMKPSDCFKFGTNYKKLLSDYCKKDLKCQYEEFYNTKISEQFTELIEYGASAEYCDDFSIISDSFYLIFDDIFSDAEGRWTVRVPFKGLENVCLLKPFENSYGLFECPKGWNYYFSDLEYVIKYPILLDNQNNEINVEKLNNNDVMINIPIKDSNTLPSGKTSYFRNAYILIQSRYYNNLQLYNEKDSEKLENLVNIDGALFLTDKYSRIRIFDKNQKNRKIVDTWFFQEVKPSSMLNITITINYDYWDDMEMPYLKEEWNENNKKIYSQINKVFSTFRLY